MVYAVVLAGGRGERFWPLSRADRPKQFLRLTSDKMMLEETIDRVMPLIPRENVRIVTNESMKSFMLNHVENVTEAHILAEPIGRNTCAAIGLAAVHLYHADPQAVMVVLSADHLIRPAEKLLKILDTAVNIAANEDRLITVGIVPMRPETGYGYIRMGELYRQQGEQTVYHVAGFTEKPRSALAHEYYYSHKYLWNSGMFVWSADSILRAIRRWQPDVGEHLDEYARAVGTDIELQARRDLYDKVISISIDFAVMEKADNVLTIKGDIVWDDIGGWTALERYKDRDTENNVVIGKAVLVDTYETTICNETDELVATLGVSDLVVVRCEDITMIIHKTKAQDVKKILAELREDDSLRKYI
jgi:mannose-1-phosphate guanylyltransferase